MAPVDDDIQFFEENGDGDDLQIFDEVDLKDPNELRQVAADIQALLQQPTTVRMTILDAQQWEKALLQYLPKSMRRGADKNVYFLRDTAKDPHNLLCSPSAVRGVNERSPVIYTDLIFAMLRCLPTGLPAPIRRGLDNVLAEACGRKLRVPIQRMFPTESRLVQALIAVLAQEYGYKPIEWARLMRRDPEKFFLALRKSKFIGKLIPQLKDDVVLGENAVTTAHKRAALIALLRSEELRMNDPLVRLTLEAAAQTLNGEGGENS
jgi:hypothetical protein